MSTTLQNNNYINLIKELKDQIHASKQRAVLSLNEELILLYHQIGTKILDCQQKQGWGTKIIEQISKDLREEFQGIRGFSAQNLKYMRRFAEVYPRDTIGQQLLTKLPWGHIITVLYETDTAKERDFYIEKAAQNHWSRNVLAMQIESKLYKRQGRAITNFQAKLPPPQSDLAQSLLKSPYIFDFLNLGDEAHEREIEKSLIAHLEKFLLELGEGFAFLGRQYHLQVDDQDFYLDLLFYHIRLRCFVVVDLKVGDFKPEYAGKMNFYLSAVDDILRSSSDNPSIGLLLCKSKGNIIAEYALRDMQKPIGLAEFRITEILPENLKTALPTVEELERELSEGLNGYCDGETKKSE